MIDTYTAGLIGFLASVVLFYGISLKFAGTPKNLRDFFHDRKLSRNTLSLIAGNLGLGTGLAYVLFGTQTFGLIYLLLPVALFVGQSTISDLIAKRTPHALYQRGTLLAGIDDVLSAQARKRVYFQRYALWCVVVTYLVSLCYEVFVSTDWIVSTFLPVPTAVAKAATAYLLLTLVVVYSTTGGYRTVQRTDAVQAFCGIGLFLAVSAFLVKRALQLPPSSHGTAPLFQTDRTVLLGFATLVLTPFTTQIYSLLNHTIASHQDTSSEQKGLFNWSKWITLSVYLILGGSALYYNCKIGDAYSAVSRWFQSPDYLSPLAVGLIAMGMGAIVMSTADTLLISTTQIVYEGFLSGDTRDSSKPMEIKSVRRLMLILYTVIFVGLGYLWITKPDKFTILFAFASPCEVLAPLIVCTIYLICKGKVENIVRPVFLGIRILDIYYYSLPPILIGALFAVYHNWKYTRAIGFCSFLFSSALAVATAFLGSTRASNPLAQATEAAT